MPPVSVSLAGPRYARALAAIRHARRAWHQLDAALAGGNTAAAAKAARQAALDVLPALDRHLDTATRMLTDVPKRPRPAR